MRALAAAGVALWLGGCASWFGTPGPEKAESTTPAPAPKPVYAVGDTYLYDDNGNPVREQVMGFRGSRVIWFNDRGMSWTANPDVISPPLTWSADGRLGAGNQQLFGDPGDIFPLEPGKSVSFLIAGSSEALPDGWQGSNACRVMSNEQVAVKAGSFNAFRIDCDRGEVTESLYYAPTVQNYVLRLRKHADAEPSDRKELVEFQYAAIPERSGTPPIAEAASAGSQRAMATAPPPMPPPMPPQTAQTAAMPEGKPAQTDLAARIQRLEDAVARLEKQSPAMMPAAASPPPTASASTPRAPARLSPQHPATQKQEPMQQAAAASESKPAGEAKPMAESKPAAAMGGGERYGVHLASYRSVAVAQQGWEKLTHSYPDLLGHAEHRTTEFDPGDGRGVFIRLLAGPYTDKADAAQLCRELQAKQVYCHVVSLGPA
jgi:hypothetical protein